MVDTTTVSTAHLHTQSLMHDSVRDLPLCSVLGLTCCDLLSLYWYASLCVLQALLVAAVLAALIVVFLMFSGLKGKSGASIAATPASNIGQSHRRSSQPACTRRHCGPNELRLTERKKTKKIQQHSYAYTNIFLKQYILCGHR